MGDPYVGQEAGTVKDCLAFLPRDWGVWNAWLNPVEISGAGWVTVQDSRRFDISGVLMLLLGDE